jgi:ABC-2 type transport system permease protein
MNLLRAEWRRLFGRRFLTVMLLIVVAILSAVAVGIAAHSQPPGPAADAKGHAAAERVRDHLRQLRDQCVNAQNSPDQASQRDFAGVDCAVEYDADHIRDEHYRPEAFPFSVGAHVLVMLFGGLFTLLAFTVGASFVGVEWASGGMMNLLTWRPNRLAVLGTKLLALLTALACIGVVLGATWLGAVYLVTRLRGDPGRITDGLLISLALDNARAIGLALAAGAIGFALASLGRRTAAALGIAIACLLVLETGLQLVLDMIDVAKPQRWALSNYVGAWLNKKVDFIDPTACVPRGAECEAAKWSLDLGDSAIVLGSGVAILVVLAFLVMRRRDVT